MEPGGAQQIVSHFRKLDASGHGFVRRADLASVLWKLGCGGVDVLLDGFSETYMNYEDFVRWLNAEGVLSQDESGQSVPLSPVRMPEPLRLSLERSPTIPEDFEHFSAAMMHLGEVAASLDEIAACMKSESERLSASLLKAHAVSLRLIRRAGQPFESDHFEASARPSNLNGAVRERLASHGPQDFREAATLLMEATGKVGEPVDDLREISASDVKKPSAISHWRGCQGLRLYRSARVSKALKLICSAPVPGLDGPSYLDLFQTLIDASWEHHIFLFGGIVRDILRRKVGNDIDIGFSAPATELEQICRKAGYKYQMDFDNKYICIGDKKNSEYVEGFTVTHNTAQPPHHADFSMNWIWYDFVNEVIIDKTGAAVPAILASRLEIPCVCKDWEAWIEFNGVRVLFRYYKFLLRGYTYDSTEMTYVAGRLLDFWRDKAEDTIKMGRLALPDMVSTQDARRVERLKELVFESFELACVAGQQQLPSSPGSRKSGKAKTVAQAMLKGSEGTDFFSAQLWWQRGWLEMLKLEDSG